MRNINPDEILKRRDYASLTDKQFFEKVQEYCREKLENLDNISETEKILQLEKFPTKRYELFKLNYDGGKIFALDTKEIYYVGDEKDKELYYSPIVLKDLCKKEKQLHETAIGIVEEAFEEDIKKAEEEIKNLKELDEQEYGLARFMYSTLEDTNILEEYKKVYEDSKNLEVENKTLKSELEKSKKNIEDLSSKLKFLLNEIEQNKNLLKVKNKNVFQKIAEKLKDILG